MTSRKWSGWAREPSAASPTSPCDPRKEAVAFAQTYFAVQTRRLEKVEGLLLEVERVRARARLVASEKELSAVIFERLGDGKSFARIRSRGDKALFGGLTTQQMKDRMDTPAGRPLADFLPTVTIKAKDFASLGGLRRDR